MKTMTTSKKLAYTVFLEPAIGDWAWVKSADDETMYVGSCITAGDYWGGDTPISQLLLEMVDSWVRLITPVETGVLADSAFDWVAFNELGIAIAKQLKLELGDDVDVRYVKLSEDPSSNRSQGFAILNDGTVIETLRKPNN